MAMRLPTGAGRPLRSGSAFGPSFGARAQLRPNCGDVQDIPAAEVEGELDGGAKDHPEGQSPRSASPGSTSAGSAVSPRMAVSSPYSSADLLAHSYPVPIVVRNTFIETVPSRPVSLEGFFQERVTVSCPGSGLEPGARPQEEESQHQQAATSVPPSVPAPPVLPPGVWQLPPAVAAPAAAAAAVMGLSPVAQASPMTSTTPAASPTAAFMVLPAGPVGPCRSFDARFQDVPSAGSAGHGHGNCKPCAFFHTKGCASGMDCVFCHLCSAGEKKRRAKDKRDDRKDRKLRQENRSWFGRA